MGFQSYALYPQDERGPKHWFRATNEKMPKAEIAKRVKDVAHPGHLGLARPQAQPTFGGQRAACRYGSRHCREPSVFLWTNRSRISTPNYVWQMRAEIARVQKRIGVAALYVTHDQTEAMTLGHRVAAVLRSGVLQQCDALKFSRTDRRIYVWLVLLDRRQ